METYLAIAIAIGLGLAFYKAYEVGIHPATLLHWATVLSLCLMMMELIIPGAILFLLCGLGYLMLLK